jgi:uncharacterized protein (TIGR00251 family)
MSRPWYQWQGDDLVLQLQIQPKAKRNEVAGMHAGRLRIRVAAPPVDGKANRALTGFLADLFGVSRTRVILEKGESGRLKTVRIHGPREIPDSVPLNASDRLK